MSSEFIDLAGVTAPDSLCGSSLLTDYAAMSEILGHLPFDDFARGYDSIDEWFAVRPIPIALPRAG